MPSYPIPVAADSPFPIQNIPFGIFSEKSNPTPRAATAIGQWVLDLAVLENHGVFDQILPASRDVFSQAMLNSFAAFPKDVRRRTREKIIAILSSADSVFFTDESLNDRAFHLLDDVTLHLPLHIPSYTDFSCFEEHVSNCFAMTNMKFLPGNNFYKSPVAYNGRTSSILPSKTDFPRPSGVYKNPTTGEAEYQPTRKLDYEMEMGIFVSSPHPFGKLLDADKAAADHIFGFVLLNDWSARDVQMYESIPVGPFNSKSFATSISPWVVVPEALQAAKTEPLNQTRESVPVHVRHKSLENTSYDILFDVYIARSGKKSTKVSTSNYKHSYYTPAQCVAHRANSGCGLETGELLGSGTISSPEKHHPDPTISRNGCLFEITWDGTREVPEIGGKFLKDGDRVTMEAWATGVDGVRIGFGQLTAQVCPALSFE